MNGCSKLSKCAFYAQYQHQQEFLLQAYVREYCLGALAQYCARPAQEERYGEPPEASVTPTGLVYPPR